MNQKLLGALRGVGYPVLFFLISTAVGYVTSNGFVDGATAGVIVAFAGLAEHALAQYLGYNLPATTTTQ